MAKNRSDGIAAVIREVESLAKRLRARMGKRATAAGLPRDLSALAAQLRKRAAAAAEQIEKYAHRVRLELIGSAKTPAKPKRKRAKPKATPTAGAPT